MTVLGNFDIVKQPDFTSIAFKPEKENNSLHLILQWNIEPSGGI